MELMEEIQQPEGLQPLEQIHFSDNFFLLRNRIQVLQELLELEINARLFNQQIMGEVRQLSELLERHEALLNERNQLQDFAELAHQLFRIKHAFLVFLRSAMYSRKSFLQQLLQEYSSEWHKVIVRISEGNEKLAEEFRNHSEGRDDDGSMVSDAELELLFKNDEA